MVKQLSIQQLLGARTVSVRSEPVVTSMSAVRSMFQGSMRGEDEHPVAVQPRLGSGVKRGRPVTGPRRGVAVGAKSNKKYLHEQSLRREPTLPQKLACASLVADLVSRWGSRTRVPRSEAEFLERVIGWLWK